MFESYDFLEFSFDYYAFRCFVDGLLDGRMKGWTLAWLKQNITEISRTLNIKELESGRYLHPLERSEYPLDEFEFSLQGMRTEGLRHGLELGVWWANVILTLGEMLEKPKLRKLRRCAAREIPAPRAGDKVIG